jgi:hypothetical protein
MRRALIATTGQLACLLVLGALSCPAQSLPSKKEMMNIVDAACARLTLGQEGSPPFHLVARMHSEGSAGEANGTYELLWASRGRFREIFQFGPITQTDVALDTKRYVLRNTGLSSYQQSEFSRLLNLPLASPPITGRRVTRVYELTSGNSSTICANLEDVYQNRKVCVDRATREIVLDAFNASGAEGSFTFEASDFTTIGPARFPLHVVRAGPHETLEVRVDKLLQASPFADGVFTPPAGATADAWCADPVIHNPGIADPEALFVQIRLLARRAHPYSQVPPEWVYLVAISANGQVQQYLPVSRDDREMDDEVGRYIKGQRFPTRRCGGRPIGYETIFELGTNFRRGPAYLL